MTVRKSAIGLGCAVLAVGSWAQTSRGAVITGETAVGSSEDAGNLRFANNAVNDSGLSGSPGSQVHDDQNTNAWQTAAAFPAVPATLTVTLPNISPDLWNITSYHIWNLNSETYRGAGNISLATIDDNNVVTERGTIALPAASGLNTYTGVDFPLSEPWRYVQKVRLTITSIQDAGQGHVGLSEVQFSGSIPEPASMSVVTMGLIALGHRTRRTR